MYICYVFYILIFVTGPFPMFFWALGVISFYPTFISAFIHLSQYCGLKISHNHYMNCVWTGGELNTQPLELSSASANSLEVCFLFSFGNVVHHFV
jgi:hypothetical protein